MLDIVGHHRQHEGGELGAEARVPHGREDFIAGDDVSTRRGLSSFMVRRISGSWLVRLALSGDQC
jgi:hypothetical protein